MSVLQKQQKKKSDKKTFECNLCQKMFSLKGNMNFHIKRVHEKLKPFPCDRCDKFFLTEGRVRTHKEISHDKVKKVQCNICNLMLPTKL